MPDFDDRLRAELAALGDAAQRQIHPPGAESVPVRARRRRRGTVAAVIALTLVLTGTAAAGWRLTHGPAPAGPAAAAGCVPTVGAAFLPPDTTDELRNQVRDVLRRSRAVSAYSYESRQQAYERFKEQFRDAPDLVAGTRPDSLPESWRFTLRCGTDYPALKGQLDALPGVDTLCACDSRTPDRSNLPGTVRSSAGR